MGTSTERTPGWRSSEGVEAMETDGRSSSGDGVRMALEWGVGGHVTGSRIGEGSNVDGEDIEQEGREE